MTRTASAEDMKQDEIRITRALISVHDKSGLSELAAHLSKRGVEIVSSGGTAAAMRAAGVQVRDVSEITGHPEILGGRVKTLHPAVHGGLLAVRGDRGHDQELSRLGIGRFDLVVANFYPFRDSRTDADERELTELIDIGGPAMIRAAAKNHAAVAAVTEPAQYSGLVEEMGSCGGCTSVQYRRARAAEAFALTAAYDAAVAEWLARCAGAAPARRRSVPLELECGLRYGENPHQRAWLYRNAGRNPESAGLRQLEGDPAGYNNYADANAAVELLGEFECGGEPACAIMKHCTPCGVAQSASAEAAYREALSCDRLSAFGGVVGMNCRLDEATAAAIAETFVEVVVAPGYDDAALRLLTKKSRVRLMAFETCPAEDRRLEFRQIAGGCLVQERDRRNVGSVDLTVRTKRKPTRSESRGMLFAWKVAKHARSNAVVLAKDRIAVGIGAGHTSRVEAAEAAGRMFRARLEAEGGSTGSHPNLSAASDGFFPFPDGLRAAAEAGASAVVQPGGSRRDDEVINVADEMGIAMAFTGVRHFRH